MSDFKAVTGYYAKRNTPVVRRVTLGEIPGHATVSLDLGRYDEVVGIQVDGEHDPSTIFADVLTRVAVAGPVDDWSTCDRCGEMASVGLGHICVVIGKATTSVLKAFIN